jgi:hypothetical protein
MTKYKLLNGDIVNGTPYFWRDREYFIAKDTNGFVSIFSNICGVVARNLSNTTISSVINLFSVKETRERLLEETYIIEQKCIEKGLVKKDFESSYCFNKTFVFEKAKLKTVIDKNLVNLLVEGGINKYFNISTERFSLKDNTFFLVGEHRLNITGNKRTIDISEDILKNEILLFRNYNQGNNNISEDALIFSFGNSKERTIVATYIPTKNILAIEEIFDNFDSKCKTILLIMEYIKDFLKPIIRKDLEVTIGTDPEFEYLINNKNYTPLELTIKKCSSKIGLDGCGRQIEFRTDPHIKIDDMIKEMSSLMEPFSNKQLSVMGDNEPLGAHIHFGTEIDGFVQNIHNFWENNIVLFDILFGSKLFLYNGKARLRNGYGSLTDFRKQPWGIEYRSLPSAIFVDKRMARIILSGFKNIVTYITNKSLKEKKVSITVSTIPSKETYLELCGWTEKEYNYFNKFKNRLLRRDLSNMTKYWVKKNSNKKININFIGDWEQKEKETVLSETNKIVTRKEINLFLEHCQYTYGCGQYIGNDKLNKSINIKNGICIGFHKQLLSSAISEIKYKIGIINSNEFPATTYEQFFNEVF